MHDNPEYQTITGIKHVSFRSPSLFYLLVHSRCRGCLFSLDHTQTHTTVGRTPLDEGSARRRDFYLTTQILYRTQTSMPPGGSRTHDPSKRSAADPCLRPRGHWDWIKQVRNQITGHRNRKLIHIRLSLDMTFCLLRMEGKGCFTLT
jgi:hypothetical protein